MSDEAGQDAPMEALLEQETRKAYGELNGVDHLEQGRLLVRGRKDVEDVACSDLRHARRGDDPAVTRIQRESEREHYQTIVSSGPLSSPCGLGGHHSRARDGSSRYRTREAIRIRHGDAGEVAERLT